MKTKYDWSKVNININWIAKDCDSAIYGFQYKPYMNAFGFGIYQGFAKRLYWLEYDDNWQDSLEERPK